MTSPRFKLKSLRFWSIDLPALLVAILLSSGCGGSSGTVTAKTEPEARFKGLRSLSEANTKEAIAEHKKQALAELKKKPDSKAKP